MDLLLGFLLGLAAATSIFAAVRLLRSPRVLSSDAQAMHAALHAATVMLPDLRRGLSAASATRAVPHLRTLIQASSVALVDRETVLAWNGSGAEHHRPGDRIELLLTREPHKRVRVESRIRCEHPDCPLGPAVLAPLEVQGEQVGSLLAIYPAGRRLTPEDTRTVSQAASLVSAQIELSELEAQGERLARAELRALRAQISPHFIYNALAAVAAYIHSSPEQARELLSDFAEFIRYAFRGESQYVTLADELRYVEKYLRLEQARFGEGLIVRLEVAPEILQAVVPMLSVQPLVENAVRHGVERRGEGRIEIVGRDIDSEIELRVSDDGVGFEDERIARVLAGEGEGIGISNVQARLHAAFGEDYGLEIHKRGDRGTTVTMTLPKFRPGVRAA
ncbi:MAG: sensor histidine kinase [Solirubrobacteraceae bacterium]